MSTPSVFFSHLGMASCTGYSAHLFLKSHLQSDRAFNYLCDFCGKHSFAARNRKDGFADSAKPWY